MDANEITKALKERDSWFANVACQDFFCMTAMCCHVRFVMMERTRESPERCLAWILQRKMQNYATDWDLRLQDIEIEQLDQSRLRDQLAAEFSAVRKSEHAQQPWIVPVLAEEVAKADHIYELRGINPYEYGPTQMICWWRTDRFFYFEAHMES